MGTTPLGIPWGLSGLCQAITAVHRHGRSHRSHWSWCIWQEGFGESVEKGDVSQAKSLLYVVFLYLYVYIYIYISSYLFPDFCPKIKTKHPGFEPIRSGEEPRNPMACQHLFPHTFLYYHVWCCPCFGAS